MTAGEELRELGSTSIVPFLDPSPTDDMETAAELASVGCDTLIGAFCPSLFTASGASTSMTSALENNRKYNLKFDKQITEQLLALKYSQEAVKLAETTLR
jgi:hypothetical protein